MPWPASTARNAGSSFGGALRRCQAVGLSAKTWMAVAPISTARLAARTMPAPRGRWAPIRGSSGDTAPSYDAATAADPVPRGRRELPRCQSEPRPLPHRPPGWGEPPVPDDGAQDAGLERGDPEPHLAATLSGPMTLAASRPGGRRPPRPPGGTDASTPG